LEKDQYKIRDAFMAEEGNTLLVADYGQLELRLMAHMTQCRSMLDAFASGGCFHSRTAVGKNNLQGAISLVSLRFFTYITMTHCTMVCILADTKLFCPGMYPHIQEAIAKGEVLLEWDYSKGDPPKPLVKDIYGSERRKAKTLNFSIAYGKTIHGLAKDWGISTEEAKETLEAWYRDRPEVKKWQEDTRAMAQHKGYVRTMMGRRRLLKEANTRGAAGGHALRAAINTPIQGSAADVVMMAMINLSNSEELKRIGWKLLLQIHDEVILEGPRENKDLAMTEVMRCMQNPFDGVGLMPLSVKLEVDAKTADTWYQAK
jgi:DNA polymerase-1